MSFQSKRMKIAIGFGWTAIALTVIFWVVSTGNVNMINTANQIEICKGSASCFEGIITKITDGDTIRVDGKSIRLALTSTPELDEIGGEIALDFTSRLCPLGANVIVDEDDGQTEGSYGRMIGLVYCNGVLLNSALLENELGYIEARFCSDSEFKNEDWAIKYGC